MRTLTLICGIPNAGKTTLSQQYENVIHLDDYRTMKDFYPLCNARAREELENRDVCVDGTYQESWMRCGLIDAVDGIQCRKVCVWVDTPFEETLRRETRKRPLSFLRPYAATLEPPSTDEGWDEVIRI